MYMYVHIYVYIYVCTSHTHNISEGRQLQNESTTWRDLPVLFAAFGDPLHLQVRTSLSRKTPIGHAASPHINANRTIESALLESIYIFVCIYIYTYICIRV